jgi:hypothetical protein
MQIFMAALLRQSLSVGEPLVPPGAERAAPPDNLFVTGLGGTALRRLELKGRQVTHQEVVFDSYGRVRDIVTGPDGLLYVALQLPGPRVSDSTPGVVVRLVPLP